MHNNLQDKCFITFIMKLNLDFYELAVTIIQSDNYYYDIIGHSLVFQTCCLPFDFQWGTQQVQ